MKNTLYYGDNLGIMREHITDETIDLIYLDPPFNSARDYNVLFKQAKKDENQAQITAFTDTWQWSKRRYEEFFDDSRNARLFPLMNRPHLSPRASIFRTSPTLDIRISQMVHSHGMYRSLVTLRHLLARKR